MTKDIKEAIIDAINFFNSDDMSTEQLIAIVIDYVSSTHTIIDAQDVVEIMYKRMENE